MNYPRESICPVKLFTLAMLLCMALSGCSEPSDPVTAIETNIEAMKTALAERDNGDFSEHLAESFAGGRDGQLNLGKDDVRRLMAGYSLRYKHMRVLLNQVSIDVDAHEPALAYMTGTVAVSGAYRLLPDSAGLYSIYGEWQNFDGVWKLRRCNWE